MIKTNEISKALAGQLIIKESQVEKILDWHIRKVPSQEREDIAQDLAETLLKAKPQTADLAFAICRNRVVDWWRHYKVHSQFDIQYGSETVDDGEGGETELIETLAGEVEFEKRICSKIDADSLFGKLPKDIQKLIQKRIVGLRLSDAERQTLHRFIKANPNLAS